MFGKENGSREKDRVDAEKVPWLLYQLMQSNLQKQTIIIQKIVNFSELYPFQILQSKQLENKQISN